MHKYFNIQLCQSLLFTNWCTNELL